MPFPLRRLALLACPLLLLLSAPSHSPEPPRDGDSRPSSRASARASAQASWATRLAVAPGGPASGPLLPDIEDRLREALLERRESARVALPLRRVRRSESQLRMLDATGVFQSRGPARTTASGTTVRRARIQKQGRPVFNRPVLLEERDGRIVRQEGDTRLAPFDLGSPLVGADAALASALAHLGAERLRGTPRVERGWFAAERATLPGYRVIAPAWEPFGSFQIDVDGRSGAVRSMVDLVRSLDGQGRVHDPNVIEDPAGTIVPLTDLDGSSTLSGSFTRVFDVETTEAFVPSLDFLFPPGDPRFVQTSVYRGLTLAGRLAVDRGFPPFPTPLLAFTNLRDPDDDSSEFDNAFYDPVFQLFGFGNGGGVLTANLGTDLDVAAHEMSHHIFQELVDPELSSLGDAVLAINEGVADTWAALVAGDPLIGESTIPGSPFLRNIDNAASFDDPFEPGPHIEGLRYGGANWDIIELIGAGAFTDVLLDALTRLPSDALPEDYRDAILAANLAVRGGADQTAIEAIFTARAFDDTGFPPDFEGFLEDGVPESRFLPDSPPDPNNLNVDFFGFAEFPGSTQVTFQTTGTGDVDLFVAALDPNVVETVFSDNFGSNETIVLNSSTALSVDDDDNWFIAVFDFPDGSGSSYELTATTVLPPSTLSLGGPPTAGSLDDLADVDFYTIETTVPNQVVQVSVAGQGNLDPIVVVLDPRTAEVQEGDDDSGTGTDAFIQGVLLPDPQTWAIAVLALAGDVDDSTAVGSYEITVSNCDNTQGGNFDGDALFDLCDGDTDDDGFGNPVDPNPFDPNLCADLDEDGCDDCTSGSFDPFGDGQDVDADGLCDLGDVDDDNDGCLDTVDPLPLFGSQDSDFDFLGDDCDNCTDVGNADQADFDAGNDDDGSLPGIQHYGDACDTDLDDDGVVGPSDFFGRFRPCLGADLATQPACVEADLDGDGVVAPSDFFSRLRPTFGTAPGPGFTE